MSSKSRNMSKDELYRLEQAEKKRIEEELKRAMHQQYMIDRTHIIFGPLRTEIRHDYSRGIYYECDETKFGYWEIFQKPIGYLPLFPDWLDDWNQRILQLSVVHSFIPYGTVRTFTTRTNKQQPDISDRQFTEEEFTKIVTGSNTIISRIKDININAYPLLKYGLNPIGVRRFFEMQVFSNPPSVELTPGLLKPYILSINELHKLPKVSSSLGLPSVKAVIETFSIKDENGKYLTSLKESPVPIYSGLFHGDTCAGDVFMEMFIGNEKRDTFKSHEERNAFFLQICKLLIIGIEKDAGDSHTNDCVNHGNFGECLSGLFDTNSAYACPHFHDNYFLINRVIMLLFSKIISVYATTVYKNEMHNKHVNHYSDALSGLGKSFNYQQYREKQKAAFTSSMSSVLKHTEAPKALVERYFDIAISIMKNTQSNSVKVEYINPLNIEACAAEVVIDTTAPDSAGLVRYVAKFEKPRNPDGKTMAHLLAKYNPLLLYQIMHKGGKGSRYFNVTTDTEDHYTPANPIAYSISDIEGETPKSLAIKRLKSMIRDIRSAGITNIESEQTAIAFFESLPEPQRDTVHVEREYFMKRNLGHSKRRTALSKAMDPDVATKLVAEYEKLRTARQKEDESMRKFVEASETESLLTGRLPSLMTGMPMKSDKPGELYKSGITVIPEGLGGGSGGCGCGMNLFGNTRRYRKRDRGSRRHRKRSGGGRKRTNSISGRFGRFGRKRKNTARKYRK